MADLEHLIRVYYDEDDPDNPHYTLYHPDDCPRVGTDEICAIDLQISEGGLSWAIAGVDGDEPLRPGLYIAQYWQTKYDVPGEPIEYDAGVECEYLGLGRPVGESSTDEVVVTRQVFVPANRAMLRPSTEIMGFYHEMQSLIATEARDRQLLLGPMMLTMTTSAPVRGRLGDRDSESTSAVVD